MSQTVFVIHGVKNHVEADFQRTVSRLQGLVPADVRLEGIFWGHLGGANQYLEQVIPSMSDREDSAVVRGPAAGPASVGVEPLEAALLAGAGRQAGEQVRGAGNKRNIAILADRAAGAEGSPGLNRLQWRQLLDEVWDETPYLSVITDEDVLAELGDALAAADPNVPAMSRSTPFPGPPAEMGAGGTEVRAFGMDAAKRAVRGVHDAISAVVSASAGRINEALRTKIAPDAAQFAGDIVVYQGENRDDIQDLVRKRVRDLGYGTADHPAHFLAHSLGGVISLDMCALPEDPLHVQGLVTFGSQWPLFSLVDPHGRVNPPYTGATPINLPATLTGRWINLWEPLDPLAFVAGHVFRLADGSKPDDRQARYRTASGLWTHSAYWQLPELLSAITHAFPPA